jgi:hypothetical protein
VLQVAPDLEVEVLYDQLDPDQGIRELPLRVESTVGSVSQVAVVTVDGKPIPSLPVRLSTEPGEVVTGTVDFKALSKHFAKGMNRLGVDAGNERTAEVLLEIEL